METLVKDVISWLDNNARLKLDNQVPPFETPEMIADYYIKTILPEFLKQRNVARCKAYFCNDAQNNFKSDYGFEAPHRTITKCKSPVFADERLHRIAIMKNYHIGSKGDIDENGVKGYISKFVCTGCGKAFKINGLKGYFHPDKD